MVFVRKKDEGTPLWIVSAVLLAIAVLSLGAAAWLFIDVDGDLMSPITDGRKTGLPIAVLVLPFGALGIAIIGVFVWMATEILRPSDGDSTVRRRRNRLR